MHAVHGSVWQSYAVSAWELWPDYVRAMHKAHGCCGATLAGRAAGAMGLSVQQTLGQPGGYQAGFPRRSRAICSQADYGAMGFKNQARQGAVFPTFSPFRECPVITPLSLFPAPCLLFPIPSIVLISDEYA